MQRNLIIEGKEAIGKEGRHIGNEAQWHIGNTSSNNRKKAKR